MNKRAVSLSVLAALIAALILVPVLPFSSAAIADGDWASLDFTVLMQQVNSINMADNEVLEYGKYCMRGFAVSPDGKYLFGGFLNPSNESAIVRFDTETGHAGGYWYYEQTEGEKIGTKSYPKGLDCDDRGYLYAGLAYNPNKIDVNFAVIKYDENGKDDLLKTVSVTNIFHDPAMINDQVQLLLRLVFRMANLKHLLCHQTAFKDISLVGRDYTHPACTDQSHVLHNHLTADPQHFGQAGA